MLKNVSLELKDYELNSKNIPLWLRGTLFYNGVGTLNYGVTSIENLLEGFGDIKKIQFNNGKVLLSNKRLLDSYTENSIKRNNINEGTQFIEEGSYISRIRNLILFIFTPFATPNNIIVNKIAEKYIAFGENGTNTLFDYDTLNVISRIYTNYLGNEFILGDTAPHIITDKNGDIYMTIVSYIAVSLYIIRIKKNSEKREVITVLPLDYAYVNHSYHCTENYVVVNFTPYYANTGISNFINGLLRGVSTLFAWNYNDETNKYIIINKKTGEIIKSYKVKNEKTTFFHTINAYEKKNKLHLYKSEYISNKNIFNTLLITTLFSDRYQQETTRLTETIIDTKIDKIYINNYNKNFITEFAQVNPNYKTVPNRYIYTPSTICEKTFTSIVCVDIIKKKIITRWDNVNIHCFETVIIPVPNSTKERDVIIVFLGFNLKTKTYNLIILDGYLKEISITDIGINMGVCIHSTYFEDK